MCFFGVFEVVLPGLAFRFTGSLRFTGDVSLVVLVRVLEAVVSAAASFPLLGEEVGALPGVDLFRD